MVRIGLIGCGTWGQKYIQSISKTKEAFISSICRVKKGIQAPADIVYFQRYEEMDNIDAVIVATPPEFHVEICEFFLSKNIPVMVEKPLSLNTKSLSKLKGHKVPFLVNHVHLFSSAFEILREELLNQENSNSEILSVAQGDGPFRTYPVLFDYGPHDLSMCLSLGLGTPSVKNYDVRLKDLGEIHNLSLLFEKTNSIADIKINNTSLPRIRLFEIKNDKFHAIYDDKSKEKLIINQKQVTIDPELPLDRAVRLFVQSVKTRKTDWRFGLDLPFEITKILESISSKVGS